ncbi:DNA gyrase/topoisomerase IV subunit A [Hyalangium rubrum]|uniref:DNA topoisomerase (ATP-hydrolyzing) n=1 Tax=Hyalangium rubrum TaxID=3103134 RepID=A0ABU5GWB5_9BACT|nr:DNA topoisomerase IV subunit A [Hyalangium sp. s54d21]MDY7225488.1 DNA topoisomerase IV subunit A [Hyalangium sp. s54d21]
MLAQADTKTRKKQGASGNGGNGSSASAGGGGGGGSVPAPLAEEARRRYINYALSVITSRALPDVRDGLKPVQRRILYGMYHDHRLTQEAKYQKSAKVVGTIMGQYHPHGDTAIYDALVRMAQDFSLRYPLVDGHGNFGSLDGDAAAAMRYTECRLAGIAGELLGELGKKTVGFRPNYDGSLFEPIVIPSRVPQLLMNGTTGIAVGMATNIPPHHLGELVDALVALIDNADLAVKDLMKWIKGPDFPTGGQILNSKAELREIYETGQGSVRIRGEHEVEETKRGNTQIIITSIPYTVNKSNLVAKIGDLVRERKLPLLLDVRDESTKEVRIVLEIKKDASPELVMAYLYKHTPLQTNFGVNLTCLVPTENPEVGAPKRLDLKSILRYFLDFRFEVVTKRFQHELGELLKRVHVLEGFEKVYDALDEMLKIIRASEGKQDAAKKLMARFKLDELQVDAILEMKLYKLARLEILVIQDELKQKRAEVKRIEGILKSKPKIWGTVKDELAEIKAAYQDKRRTRIGGAGSEEVEFSAEAFIADEDAHVVLTRDGWIKRVREVKDPSSTRLREGDAVMTVLAGSLKANLVLFSNFGAAYVTRFNDVPASTGYGDPVQKLFKFDDGERIVGALSLDGRLPRPEKLIAVTKDGLGLRFLLEGHTEVSTRSGRRYAKTGEGDEIIGVQPVGEKDLLAVLTEKTSALVCKVAEVNELQGPGKGVMVIKVEESDRVVEFLAVAPGQKDRAIDYETQKGRKLSLHPAKYEVTGRGGKGHEMSRKDAVKEVTRTVTFIPLPEPKKD